NRSLALPSPRRHHEIDPCERRHGWPASDRNTRPASNWNAWPASSESALECFHLEVRRSHPRLYRTEWMLDSLAAKAHFCGVSIEPRLHGLKDGFVLPT